MKKTLLLLLLALNLTAFGQYQQGGIKIVGGVAVMQLDTNARTIIKIIEDERIAGGGSAFTANEKWYVNYLVTNLKKIGVWTKIKALYGFVGGTASSHKWNWKDMRDLDAAFRLTYGGTLTHSANGVQGDGSTGYADTHFNPYLQLTINSTIINYTNIYNSGSECGIRNNSPVERFSSSNSGINSFFSQFRTNIYNANVPNGLGVKISTTNSIGIFGFYNGIKVINNSIVSGNYPNNNFYLLCVNQGLSSTYGATDFLNGRLALSIVCNDYLTDEQSIQTSNIVTFSQGILSRK